MINKKLVKTPYMNTAVFELISQMLHLNSKHRPSAEKVFDSLLFHNFLKNLNIKTLFPFRLEEKIEESKDLSSLGIEDNIEDDIPNLTEKLPKTKKFSDNLFQTQKGKLIPGHVLKKPQFKNPKLSSLSGYYQDKDYENVSKNYQLIKGYELTKAQKTIEILSQQHKIPPKLNLGDETESLKSSNENDSTPKYNGAFTIHSPYLIQKERGARPKILIDYIIKEPEEMKSEQENPIRLSPNPSNNFLAEKEEGNMGEDEGNEKISSADMSGSTLNQVINNLDCYNESTKLFNK